MLTTYSPCLLPLPGARGSARVDEAALTFDLLCCGRICRRCPSGPPALPNQRTAKPSSLTRATSRRSLPRCSPAWHRPQRHVATILGAMHQRVQHAQHGIQLLRVPGRVRTNTHSDVLPSQSLDLQALPYDLHAPSRKRINPSNGTPSNRTSQVDGLPHAGPSACLRPPRSKACRESVPPPPFPPPIPLPSAESLPDPRTFLRSWRMFFRLDCLRSIRKSSNLRRAEEGGPRHSAQEADTLCGRLIQSASLPHL